MMPEMSGLVRFGMCAFVVLIVATIVVYHTLMGRRLGRGRIEPGRSPAPQPREAGGQRVIR
jgi:hypothetical protein